MNSARIVFLCRCFASLNSPFAGVHPSPHYMCGLQRVLISPLVSFSLIILCPFRLSFSASFILPCVLLPVFTLEYFFLPLLLFLYNLFLLLFHSCRTFRRIICLGEYLAGVFGSFLCSYLCPSVSFALCLTGCCFVMGTPLDMRYLFCFPGMRYFLAGTASLPRHSSVPVHHSCM